jgi:uncharacterized protein (DUF2384 family)
MMSPEQMNTFLVSEMKRINKGREPIDIVMTEMGITSVQDLTAEQQQHLVAAVRAIPA